MTGFAWLVLTAFVSVLVGFMAYFRSPTGINAGLLAGTFLAIIWYSWETHRLVDLHQESGEIDRHPWLSATSLKVDEIGRSEAAPLGGFNLSLPIENHGRTPAYVGRITVDGGLAVGSHGCTFAVRDRAVENQVIVPGDFLSVRLGTLTFTGPHAATVETRARIEYGTADGGRGVLTVGFRYRDGEWTNLDTMYDFTLRDGRTFPSHRP